MAFCVVFLLLLTGPPGAGKSSVATAVQDHLGDQGVASALIEADDLRRCYPPLEGERLREHISMLAKSYREVGHQLLLVTETVEDVTEYEQLVAALGPREVLLVRLQADAATLKARLTAREPASWSGLPALILTAERLAASMQLLPGVDLVVNTESLSAEDAAVQIMTALRARWPALPIFG